MKKILVIAFACGLFSATSTFAQSAQTTPATNNKATTVKTDDNSSKETKSVGKSSSCSDKKAGGKSSCCMKGSSEAKVDNKNAKKNEQ